MKRPSLLVPALTIAALLAVAPVAAAAASSPSPDAASIEFELDGNNGLYAHVEGFDNSITLSIGNKHNVAFYIVDGESTKAGLKAQFGKLGSIDVTYRPTETVNTSEPPPECKGEPWVDSEGLFEGTIQFTGEREYVRIDATQAEGKMQVTPQWKCRNPKGPIRLNPALRPSAQSPREKSKAEAAALYARNRDCRCSFRAFATRIPKETPWTTFSGGKLENREGMKIARIAFTEKASPSSFTFNHKAGTARVDPPYPFTGTATFKRRKGRDLWRSTLRVPLLGTDPVSLRGRGFRARLARQLPGD
jgi:hypothetical protein